MTKAAILGAASPRLFATAKVNGVEPFAYLKATLTAIASGW
nr:transposase domain-containing protein [Paracoccus mutanolyticus]